MEIYTNATYELVPWVSSGDFYTGKDDVFPKNIKLGNLYVILRFLFIDMWELELAKIRGVLNEKIVSYKIHNLLNLAYDIRTHKKYNILRDKTFCINDYIGRYRDEVLYFKNKIKDEKNPIYFPLQYKSLKGTYRTI